MIEIEEETEMSREEIAEYFEALAEGFRGEGQFEVVVGKATVEIDPSDPAEVEVEYEDDGSEAELEIEVEWHYGEHDYGEAGTGDEEAGTDGDDADEGSEEDEE